MAEAIPDEKGHERKQIGGYEGWSEGGGGAMMMRGEEEVETFTTTLHKHSHSIHVDDAFTSITVLTGTHRDAIPTSKKALKESGQIRSPKDKSFQI